MISIDKKMVGLYFQTKYESVGISVPIRVQNQRSLKPPGSLPIMGFLYFFFLARFLQICFNKSIERGPLQLQCRNPWGLWIPTELEKVRLAAAVASNYAFRDNVVNPYKPSPI